MIIIAEIENNARNEEKLKDYSNCLCHAINSLKKHIRENSEYNDSDFLIVGEDFFTDKLYSCGKTVNNKYFVALSVTYLDNLGVSKLELHNILTMLSKWKRKYLTLSPMNDMEDLDAYYDNVINYIKSKNMFVNKSNNKNYSNKENYKNHNKNYNKHKLNNYDKNKVSENFKNNKDVTQKSNSNICYCETFIQLVKAVVPLTTFKNAKQDFKLFFVDGTMVKLSSIDNSNIEEIIAQIMKKNCVLQIVNEENKMVFEIYRDFLKDFELKVTSQNVKLALCSTTGVVATLIFS